MHEVYNKFMENKNRSMNSCRYGDQEFILNNIKEYDLLQHLFPNKIISFKVHCRINKIIDSAVPKDASIVCFHGNPRPHTIMHPDLKQYWNP